MALQQRTVAPEEASRVLVILAVDLRKQAGSRYTYWSKKLGTWVYVDKLRNGTYTITWDGTADCGC